MLLLKKKGVDSQLSVRGSFFVPPLGLRFSKFEIAAALLQKNPTAWMACGCHAFVDPHLIALVHMYRTK